MAWTVTAALEGSFDREDGTYFKFVLTCTSDAGASGDQTLSTLLASAYDWKIKDTIMNQILGSELMWVEYLPDGTATPTSDPTVTIDNGNESNIFNYAFTAATKEIVAGAEELGAFPVVKDLIFASTTLANTKKAVFNIWLKK